MVEPCPKITPSSVPAPEPHSTGKFTKTKRILLVDDDCLARTVFERSLLRKGYGVTSVASCLQALEHLEREVFDLLITDHHMPELSGLDLIRLLRKRECRVPSLLISGHMPPEASSMLDELSPGHFLHKPFDLVQLLEKVESLMGA